MTTGVAPTEPASGKQPPRNWAGRWAGRRHFYPHLAAMPVFAGCARRQIWRIARWGDVIEVQPGDVLAREDRSNHWFFVLLAGSVKVSRGRRDIATLRRGGHFGEIAVIGFRPQPATVTVLEPSVLFVMSRRLFVSLAAMDVSIQQALFPDVERGGYRSFVRDMHEEGRAEWERLKPHLQVESTTGPASARPLPAGRRLSWADAVETLTQHDQNRPGLYPVPAPGEIPRAKMSRPLSIVLATCFAVIFALLGLTFHPPIAVLTAARPIDVTKDITITGGLRSEAPTGAYLLTAVSVDRPNLFGAAYSWVRGRRIVRVEGSEVDETDPGIERREARRAFLNSHKQAVTLAERSLGVDPEGIAIVIRDRGIGGPSAGLIYALAIIDMLDPADLAGGRVIAATGELTPAGQVAPVGFLSLKVDVARGGGADIFLVPDGQARSVGAKEPKVVGVKDLASAVRFLKQR